MESGSRAWGFESANSDYDVRFVYWKPLDWYLSIENHRDVIEEMGDDDLDFAGWDIRKALKLAYKSNPSLHDWLATPDLYFQHSDYFPEFKQLCLDYFDPNACFHHFRSMARTNFKDYLQADEVPFKKYFYGLRPLMCARYIAIHHEPAPCRFDALLAEFYPSGDIREAIDVLLSRKKSGVEIAKTKRIEPLHSEIARLLEDNEMEPQKRDRKETGPLNEFFRRVIADMVC